jgi:hypothetical protein
MEPIVLANGNSINVGHKWDVKVQLLDLIFWQLMYFKKFNEKATIVGISKGLVWLIVNE